MRTSHFTSVYLHLSRFLGVWLRSKLSSACMCDFREWRARVSSCSWRHTWSTWAVRQHRGPCRHQTPSGFQHVHCLVSGQSQQKNRSQQIQAGCQLLIYSGPLIHSHMHPAVLIQCNSRSWPTALNTLYRSESRRALTLSLYTRSRLLHFSVFPDTPRPSSFFVLRHDVHQAVIFFLQIFCSSLIYQIHLP